MIRTATHRRLRLSSALLAALAPGLAAAQEAPVTRGTGGLEEIVVTAQKREQNLQDVGIALTAISGADLARRGYAETTDIVQQVPSLQFQSTSTFTTLNIRGVSQTEFTDQNELPVAVVVDGVYISSPGAVQTQLFDINRVEVLRGPQGTLFGRNSTGGLVHFISNKPTESLSVYVNMTYGSYNQVKVDGAIGGPLASDKVLGRLSVAANYHDGYLENTIGPDVLSARNYSGRGQLQFLPNDDLSILVKLQSSVNDDERNGGYVWDPAAPGPDGLGVHVGRNENPWGTCDGCDLLGYRNPSSDPFRQSMDTDGYFDRTATEGSITADWKTALGTFTSVTDFYTHDKKYLEDTDASPNPLFVYETKHELKQFSQEFRLSSTSDDLFWVVGLYYLNIESDFFQSLAFNFGPGVDFFGYDKRTDDTSSMAAFGQIELPLGDRFKVVTGLRLTSDTKKLDAVTVPAFGDGSQIVIDRSTIGKDAEQKFDNWQGKLQLEWRPADDYLVYAGVSRGTKAGGFQGSLNPDPELLVFDQEELTSYEVGFKLTTLSNKVRLNGSAFYYDYKDYQAFTFNQTTLAANVQNRPAEVTGAELELFAHPVAPLEMAFGLSLLDAKAEGIVLPSGAVVDRALPQAPDVSVNGLLRYRVPVSSGNFFVQVDGKYNADSYFTVNNAPVENEDAYWIGNASVAYESGDGRWGASVFVKNLSDTYYRVYALDVSGLGFSNDRPGLPRWFGISFNYNLAP